MTDSRKDPIASMELDTCRIGLIGGTFDPVHFGHLRAGEEIKERFDLQVIEFIPALISPHKLAPLVTDARHRVTMLHMAIHNNQSFRVSEVEIHRGGISYLFDTLHEYRIRLGDKADLFFIMGMDNFIEIASWHRCADLFTLSNFIVTTRPGYQHPLLIEVLPKDLAKRFKTVGTNGQDMEHESGKRIYFEMITSLEISATDIRKSIASGRSVRYLLPDSVWMYIQDNHLYSQEESIGRK